MTDRSRSVGIDRRTLALAVPNLLASVSVPLLGVADTAMIGHLPDVAFIGAVASARVRVKWQGVSYCGGVA